jgi:proline dehydrogenase
MYIPLYNRFIAGSTLKQAIIRANKLLVTHKYKPIYDYSYEDKNNEIVCYKEIKNIASTLKNDFIAIKLSGLNFNKKYTQDIIHTGIKNNNKFLIDAENYEIQQKINDITNDLLLEFNNSSNAYIYKTYQMYRKDSYAILQQDLTNFYDKNILLGIKLVRGAYYKTDYKVGGILFDNIEQTHNSYDSGSELILQFQKKVNNNIIFATHNDNSITKIVNIANINNLVKDNISFAQLLGMADKTSDNIIKKGYSVYKYFPYGPMHYTLPYFSRRLYENYEIVKYISLF